MPLDGGRPIHTPIIPAQAFETFQVSVIGPRAGSGGCPRCDIMTARVSLRSMIGADNALSPRRGPPDMPCHQCLATRGRGPKRIATRGV